MELPVSPQSYTESPDALIRAVKRVDVILARMAADETDLDVATAMTNPDRRDVPLVNFATDVRLPEDHEPSDVLDCIEEHFRQAGCVCRMLSSNESQWPLPLAEQISSLGYRNEKRWVYRLTGYTRPELLVDSLQIIPARAAYNLLHDFFKQATIEQDSEDDGFANDRAATLIDHLDEPRNEAFLGRINGQSAGFVSLVSLGQIGVIDKVHTRLSSSGQDVTTTLLAHAIDHCQRAQFETVITEIADGQASTGLFERIGFRPVISFDRYIRDD